MIELKHQMAAMTTPPPVPEEGEGEAGAAGFIQDSDDASSLAADFSAESLLQKNIGSKVNKAPVLTQEMLHGANMNRLLKIMEKTVNSFSGDVNAKRDKQATGLVQEDPLAGLGQSAGGENRGPAAEEEKQDPDEQLAAFEGLKKKAEEALQRERDGEVNAQQNHAMNKQALTNQMNLLKDKEADCKKDKLDLTEEKENALGEISELADSK